MALTQRSDQWSHSRRGWVLSTGREEQQGCLPSPAGFLLVVEDGQHPQQQRGTVQQHASSLAWLLTTQDTASLSGMASSGMASV
jgi:hypothetical protein